MKTLQIMTGEDRVIDWVRAPQDTNEYFNATFFLEWYNDKYGTKKKLQNFLDNTSTKLFIEALEKELTIHNHSNSGELETRWDRLKQATWHKKLVISKRGKNGGTWINPYIFLKFAMWLSPALEAKVHIMLVDRLILFRHQCWDWYKIISSAIQKNNPLALPREYKDEANLINTIVFWKPEGGQRNSATQSQLELMDRVQKVDAKLIEKGLNYTQRADKLRAFLEFLE